MNSTNHMTDGKGLLQHITFDIEVLHTKPPIPRLQAFCSYFGLSSVVRRKELVPHFTLFGSGVENRGLSGPLFSFLLMHGRSLW